MNSISVSRIKKELEMFSTAPPSGISCCPQGDRLDSLSAQILGAPGTPYEEGTFQLEIQIPDRYPFEPPRVRFVTPIYHPNIDTSGRICLDTLKLPPKGSWRPCLNISTVLLTIRVLMAEPGSEDPLMTSIWQEFQYDYTTYVAKAKQWTKQHAMSNSISKENLHVNSHVVSGEEDELAEKENSRMVQSTAKSTAVSSTLTDILADRKQVSGKCHTESGQCDMPHGRKRPFEQDD